MYDDFRLAIDWQRQQGPEKLPGVRDDAPAVKLRARSFDETDWVGGDRIQRRAIHVEPGHDVQPGDMLDGAEVLETSDVKDRNGNLRYRICYVEK